MNRRLFVSVLSVESRKLMSYRADFWLKALAVFAVEMTVAVFLWRAIFAESGQQRIAGFSLRGMVLYYVLVLLLGKLVRGDEHRLSVAEDIYQGTLTRYLLYPGRYFTFKYAEHLGSLLPATLQLGLFGGAALLVLDLSPVGRITAVSTLAALAAVAVANLMAFLLTYTVQAVAFWADNVWSLNVMLRFAANMLGGLMLPLDLFPGWARQLVELTPFPYLFYFPVMTLLGRVPPGEWLGGIALGLGWCALLMLAARALWRRGELTYTGVGI